MTLFLVALACGAGFGLLYGVLCFPRALLAPGRLPGLLWDAVYLLLCGAATFLLVLVESAGEMRFFVLEGEALGFLLYHFSLGGVLGRAMRAAGTRVRGAVLHAGRRVVVDPCVRAGKKWGAYWQKKRNMPKKIPAKARKAANLRLKPVWQMMYNHFYRTRHNPPKKTVSKK